MVECCKHREFCQMLGERAQKLLKLLSEVCAEIFRHKLGRPKNFGALAFCRGETAETFRHTFRHNFGTHFGTHFLGACARALSGACSAPFRRTLGEFRRGSVASVGGLGAAVVAPRLTEESGFLFICCHYVVNFKFTLRQVLGLSLVRSRSLLARRTQPFVHAMWRYGFEVCR